MDNLPNENVFVRYPQPLTGGKDSLYLDSIEERVRLLAGNLMADLVYSPRHLLRGALA